MSEWLSFGLECYLPTYPEVPMVLIMIPELQRRYELTQSIVSHAGPSSSIREFGPQKLVAFLNFQKQFTFTNVPSVKISRDSTLYACSSGNLTWFSSICGLNFSEQKSWNCAASDVKFISCNQFSSPFFSPCSYCQLVRLQTKQTERSKGSHISLCKQHIQFDYRTFPPNATTVRQRKTVF